MNLHEIEYWLRAAQIECQRTVYRQITASLVGIVMAWCLMACVVGTPNPLLLFNPNFQPSWWVRVWSLWCVALLGSASARAIYLATMKSHELRLGLHPSITLNQPPTPAALFFESKKSQ
jgi:hypothetical protein